MILVKAIAALAVLAQLADAQLSANGLRFSEIYPAPSAGEHHAFVEIYNPTGDTVDGYAYSICTSSNRCTQFAGSIAAGAYYVLCRDISTHMFCNMGTDLPLNEISKLYLMKDGANVDEVDWQGAVVDSSYTRGTISSNLLTFQWSTPATAGTGLLGGSTPAPVVTPTTPAPVPATPVPTTASPIVLPTPAPTPSLSVPGVNGLFLNEVSIEGDVFVEIAFRASKSISNYVLSVYNAFGNVLATHTLSEFAVGSAAGGLTFASLQISLDTNAITLNGNKIVGFAITGENELWDFVSIGGFIFAQFGEAQGNGATQLGSGSQYQRRGTGCDKTAFPWVLSSSATKGAANTNEIPTCNTAAVFINEFELGLSVGNFIEVALTSSLSAGNYIVALYSRSTGNSFASLDVGSGAVVSASNGVTFVVLSLDGMTTPNGFALVNVLNGHVLEFLSVDGTTFTATSGVATGSTSEDFPVSQTGSRVYGGYSGEGCSAGEFSLGTNGLSAGFVNLGQTINCSGNIVSSALIPLTTPSPTTLAPTPAPTTLAPTPAPTNTPTTPGPTISTDECATGTHNCHKFAICTDTPNGGFTCACPSGFVGDGLLCADIDECLASPCSVNAFCVDNDGTFTCTCNVGYEGNGFSCTDENECDGTNPCGANANCVNTDGSFTCECQDGFLGDAFAGCTDEDECGNGDNCDSNASCTNTDGGFTCACNSGYTGDGVTCDLITPSPTTAAPTELVSDAPTMLPTVSESPSISDLPSTTSFPSDIPSLSESPSQTNPPSMTPSLSLMPSKTDMPSSEPSLSDAPTNR